eukprot:NODE_4871_length_1836_cov_3.769456.p1 GENE.NODE_4871_length_1836_cov_3.769456~~NODE_4871_length_1836_cov_3.769456.p1  ORF type:complete len:331 (+),score=115.76 NODE_4871_length_1836_cov_3.769456:751-1743(+)
MVDGGLHGFKPFVHSDCGGDYTGGAGDLMRWTAHCAFGSILRFHGGDHRSWMYGNHTVSTVRKYLNARYRLMPSLIAAGRRATETGFPLVARGDFYWPEHAESRSNHQYVFVDALLIAPIWNSSQNITSRSVWVPPGEWQHAWDGSVVTGPKHVIDTQPYERQPMWFRRNNSLLVLVDEPATRVEEQDWSSLTLEAFPSHHRHATRHAVFERDSGARTDIAMRTDGRGKVRLEIGEPEQGGLEREWLLRLHLLRGQRAAVATVEGLGAVAVRHVEPQASGNDFFPLGGAGSAPAPLAGPVAEVWLPRASGRCVLEATIVEDDLAATVVVL